MSETGQAVPRRSTGGQRPSRRLVSSACSRSRAATSWGSTTAASTRASAWSTSVTNRPPPTPPTPGPASTPGKVGVAILTAGPGVTDGVTGVANAWRANSPILVFGGQGPFNNLRRGSLQEMDHVSVMKPITKWADACYETSRIGEYVELADPHRAQRGARAGVSRDPHGRAPRAGRPRQRERAGAAFATTGSPTPRAPAAIDEALADPGRQPNGRW